LPVATNKFRNFDVFLNTKRQIHNENKYNRELEHSLT